LINFIEKPSVPKWGGWFFIERPLGRFFPLKGLFLMFELLFFLDKIFFCELFPIIAPLLGKSNA
jgi:hypothetical protein